MRADNRAGLHKCVDLVVRQSHGYLFMSYFTSPVNHCPLMHAKTPEQGPSLRAIVEYLQNPSERTGSFYRKLVPVEPRYYLMKGQFKDTVELILFIVFKTYYTPIDNSTLIRL